MSLKQKKLALAWCKRLKLYNEGDKFYAESRKLRAESDKFRAEGDKLYAESDKLYAEGRKLYAEGDKLRAEGDILWAKTVLEVYGNVTIKWESTIVCMVDGKLKFQGEKKNETDGETG